jgi:hypothetical protein
MEDAEMGGEMSPAAGALGMLRKKRANLGMVDPATTNKEGTEFMIDKSMAPANLKPGQEVCIMARVTKSGGSQISFAPTSVELESPEEDAGEPGEEEATAPAAKEKGFNGRVENPTGNIKY